MPSAGFNLQSDNCCYHDHCHHHYHHHDHDQHGKATKRQHDNTTQLQNYNAPALQYCTTTSHYHTTALHVYIQHYSTTTLTLITATNTTLVLLVLLVFKQCSATTSAETRGLSITDADRVLVSITLCLPGRLGLDGNLRAAVASAELKHLTEQ